MPDESEEGFEERLRESNWQKAKDARVQTKKWSQNPTESLLPEKEHVESIPSSSNESLSETTHRNIVSTQTFTIFPKLPPELRLRIWTLTANTPRNIDIWSREDGGVVKFTGRDRHGNFQEQTFRTVQTTSTQSVPAILLVSKESRTVGLKHYTLILGHEKPLWNSDVGIVYSTPPTIWCNLNTDCICPMPDKGFNVVIGLLHHHPLPSTIAIQSSSCHSLFERGQLHELDEDLNILQYDAVPWGQTGKFEFVEVRQGRGLHVDWEWLGSMRGYLLSDFWWMRMREKSLKIRKVWGLKREETCESIEAPMDWQPKLTYAKMINDYSHRSYPAWVLRKQYKKQESIDQPHIKYTQMLPDMSNFGAVF